MAGTLSTTIGNTTGTTVSSTATCTGTTKVLGGGYTITSGDDHVIASSSSYGAGETWTVTLLRTSGGSSSATIKAFAICA